MSRPSKAFGLDFRTLELCTRSSEVTELVPESDKRRQKVEKGTGAPTRKLQSELARSFRLEPIRAWLQVDAGSEDTPLESTIR